MLLAKEDTPALRMALHRSSALVTTINDRLDYFGEALHLLRTMLHMAEANELILTASVLPIRDAAGGFKLNSLQAVPLEQIVADSATITYRRQPV